jgi:hypothetical protein
MDRDVISYIAIGAGLFLVGVSLGVLWFRKLALPLLYTVPRASWWTLKGRLRWWTVPLSLVSPFLWSAAFVAALYLLLRFAPDVFEHLYSSASFFVGLWFGISVGTFRALGTKSGRQKLHDNFLDFVRPWFKRLDPQQEQWGEEIHQRVWHLSRGGRRYGPFALEELHRRAARGEIYDGDLLWRQGVAEWVEASSILKSVPTANPNRH